MSRNNLDFIKNSSQATKPGKETPQEPKSTKKKKTKKIKFVKRTYNMSPDIVSALNLMVAYEGGELSEVVREACIKHIPKKYFDMQN